jgi:chloramphenicol 3-O-phosphotransferase
MGEYRYTEVFVPGGFPLHTYNPRLDLRLEDRVRQVLENLCKLVIVTGHTKSGKTVLVRNILPREDAVWVDGGAVGAEEDFWTTVIDQLDLFQGTDVGKDKTTGAEFEAKGKVGANFLVAKGEAELGGKLSTERAASSGKSRSVSSRVVALKGLASAGRALVIDDFHYLPRELQGDVIRALKPLIFDGLPVVIIAIPHRRYDAVKVEREMTGRILPVSIPPWSEEELSYIPLTGFHSSTRLLRMISLRG